MKDRLSCAGESIRKGGKSGGEIPVSHLDLGVSMGQNKKKTKTVFQGPGKASETTTKGRSGETAQLWGKAMASGSSGVRSHASDRVTPGIAGAGGTGQ